MSTPSSPSSDQASGLDLAARSIDLVSTIANASSKSHPLLSGLLEVGEWLGRERLNRYALQDCLQKAKGLAMTNSTGEGLLAPIVKESLARPVGHLFLKQSGSLGALLARDPYLRWMISSVACLFQFTGNQDFVSDALCDFILGSNDPDTSNAITQMKTLQRLDPYRIQLRAVVEKIVSSVWLNIVNSGFYKVELPDELLQICPKGHDLDDHLFAEVAVVLRNRYDRLIIRSEFFFKNLGLWLLHHFHGSLQVTVGSKIVFKQKLGPEDRDLDMRIASYCSPENECTRPGQDLEFLFDASQRFAVMTKNGLGTLLDSELQNSGARRKLYALPNALLKHRVLGDDQLQYIIEDKAWRILYWILSLPLKPPPIHADELFFRVPSSPKKSTYSLGDILHRVPAMINFEWSTSGVDDRGKEPVIRNVRKLGRHRTQREKQENHVKERTTADVKYLHTDEKNSLEHICEDFIVLHSLMRKCARSCFCGVCKSTTLSEQNLFKLRNGCLKTEALKSVMTLVAHAIADGMGCTDVSGAESTDSVVDGITTVIIEAVYQRKIVWDTWFAMAGSVTLGCAFKHRSLKIYAEGTSFAAIQYGDIALVAAWLDITQKLDVLRCFSVHEGQGKIGLMSTMPDGSPHFTGVQEDFAIIQTEKTQDLTPYGSPRFSNMEKLKVGNAGPVPPDLCSSESHIFLLSTRDEAYRILFKVQSATNSRIVDPRDALLGLLNAQMNRPMSGENTGCEHRDGSNPDELIVSDMSPDVIISTFDELLGQWKIRFRNLKPDTNLENSDSSDSKDTGEDPVLRVDMTTRFDTALKINVALALSITRGTVLCYTHPICPECCQKRKLTWAINAQYAGSYNQSQIALR